MHRLSRDGFLKVVRAGEAPTEAQLSALCPTKAEVVGGEGSRKVRFVISTASVDRQNDTVSQTGWRLDRYLLNPVVLFGHNYRGLPVGRCTALAVDGDKLMAEVEFMPAAVSAFADEVFRIVKWGGLNATSVGFRPIKWAFNEERGGFDFIEQELLEFSIVSVPANPEALVTQRALAAADSADRDLLKGWAEETLALIEPGGCWVPKAQVLKLAQETSTSTFSADPAATQVEASQPAEAAPAPEATLASEVAALKAEVAKLTALLMPKTTPEAEAPKGDGAGTRGCDLGGDCPMKDGMEHCPKGEACPMGRGKAADPALAEKAEPEDGVIYVLEVDDPAPEPAGPVYVLANEQELERGVALGLSEVVADLVAHMTGRIGGRA